MSLKVTSLNSGSNGNCYYIGNESEAILIDAGLSCRETIKRMNRLHLDIHKVKAIIISHEHTDHIKGVEVLSKNYNIPVYITDKTYLNSKLNLKQTIHFDDSKIISIGSFEIQPFRKYHDAIDPHSFTVNYLGFRVGIFTDIGRVCKNLIGHFEMCHLVILEANYDSEMLTNGRYPYFLKQRIAGGNGHLSNDEAFFLFKNYKFKHLSHILLAHLSKENNSPSHALSFFKEYTENIHVSIASRECESELFEFHTLPDQHKIESLQLNLF